MKILYIQQALENYLGDMVFHGLTSLGEEVVDYNRLWYMWHDNLNDDVKQWLYGRGFTLYGSLSGTDNHIDRSDIKTKIRNHFFDLIIYSSIWGCMDLWELVSACYDKSEIVIVDGQDFPDIHFWLTGCHYFKRELACNTHNIHPIGFSIPKKAFRIDVAMKTKVVATVIPGDRETYKFTDEASYYADYSTSFYGLTTKKSGWDALRPADDSTPLPKGFGPCQQQSDLEFATRSNARNNNLTAHRNISCGVPDKNRRRSLL
jgi:hypothetical protein